MDIYSYFTFLLLDVLNAYLEHKVRQSGLSWLCDHTEVMRPHLVWLLMWFFNVLEITLL